MKIYLFALSTVLLCVPAISADPQPTAVERVAVSSVPTFVPRGHWSYGVLEALNQAGMVQGLPEAKDRLRTRYEFAVAAYTIMAPLSPKSEVNTQELNSQIQRRVEDKVKNSPAAKNSSLLIAGVIALSTEFSDEMGTLGVQFSSGPVTKIGGRVVVPQEK